MNRECFFKYYFYLTDGSGKDQRFETTMKMLHLAEVIFVAALSIITTACSGRSSLPTLMAERDADLYGKDGGLGCDRGQVLCAGSCIDPLTSLNFCGASGDCKGANAGSACQAGQVCSAGKCALSCQKGLINCGGICIDPLTSLIFCGASGDCAGANAGAACEAGQVCSAGKCTLSCQKGLINCGGTCIDPLTSMTFCGASGDCAGSNSGTTCQQGEICSSGKCTVSCQNGLINCGGTCIDPQTSTSYCQDIRLREEGTR